MTWTPGQVSRLAPSPPLYEQERMVEAILFASTEPVTVAELSAMLLTLELEGRVVAEHGRYCRIGG